ncbi:MAG: hypothetical protein QOF41_2374 [Methylobacteriaceae bacterium]|nr:hypothetical protein [Methylobacteriaceae bacterium]
MPPLLDISVGLSLGALLGMLVGLSGSPVVSSVVTGIVALLAGLFGLSEKITSGLTSATARRLIAFALAALVVTPLAVYVRTHDWLASSVSLQRAKLIEMGVTDKKEQLEVLRFINFGILPPGASAVPKDSPSAGVVTSRQGVLFQAPGNFCTSFLRLLDASPNDILTLFDQQSPEMRSIADMIRRLPEDQRKSALDFGRIFLCGVS